MELTNTFYDIKKISESTNSCVYKAQESLVALKATRSVVIKCLKSENPDARLRKEFYSLQKINSPYCIKVYGCTTFNNQPALVTEFFPGITLWQFSITHSKKLKNNQRSLLKKIHRGLLDLHKSGLCFGDLSPKNILVCPKTLNIRLIDFGLANYSMNSVHITPGFAHPKTLQLGLINTHTDLYAFKSIKRWLKQTLNKPSPNPYKLYIKLLFSGLIFSRALTFSASMELPHFYSITFWSAKTSHIWINNTSYVLPITLTLHKNIKDVQWYKEGKLFKKRIIHKFSLQEIP